MILNMNLFKACREFLCDYKIFKIIPIAYVFVSRKLDNPGEIWSSLHLYPLTSMSPRLISLR